MKIRAPASACGYSSFCEARRGEIARKNLRNRVILGGEEVGVTVYKIGLKKGEIAMDSANEIRRLNERKTAKEQHKYNRRSEGM